MLKDFIVVFHVFKKWSRDMEDKKDQIRFLKIKTVLSKIKGPLDGISNRLDTAEEKISHL